MPGIIWGKKYMRGKYIYTLLRHCDLLYVTIECETFAQVVQNPFQDKNLLLK